MTVSEVDRRALKTAFRRLVAAVGGVVPAAACTRVADSQIARYYDQAEASLFPPADIIADLEAVAGSAIVTAELARLAGLRLVALDAADGSQSHLAVAVAEYARGAGEVPAALCDGLADGHLTPAELGTIARRAGNQLQQLAAIAAEATALAGHASPAAPAVRGEGTPAARSPAPGAGGGRRPPTAPKRT